MTWRSRVFIERPASTSTRISPRVNMVSISERARWAEVNVQTAKQIRNIHFPREPHNSLIETRNPIIAKGIFSKPWLQRNYTYDHVKNKSCYFNGISLISYVYIYLAYSQNMNINIPHDTTEIFVRVAFKWCHVSIYITFACW